MFRNLAVLDVSDVEHETLVQLFHNFNRGIQHATFSCPRLDDNHPDAIAIHQVFEGMNILFDVNEESKKGGHPAWLSTNKKPKGAFSYEAIANEPDRANVHQNSPRILSATHSNPHYLYFLSLNYSENPRIQDFNGKSPTKNLKKRLSHKEAQLLFFFCTAKTYLLGGDLFYACFCHINNDALNRAAGMMQAWLTSEDGKRVVKNLSDSQYTSQYLDPLFRLVASTTAKKWHIDIEEISSFP